LRKWFGVSTARTTTSSTMENLALHESFSPFCRHVSPKPITDRNISALDDLSPQNHYPERLGVLILVDAPFVFRAFWKVISPFVDAKTLKKVVFVSGSKNEKRKILEVTCHCTRPFRSNSSSLTTELLTLAQEFIDLKDLPAKYFGDSDFLFDAERHIQWLKQGEEEKAKEKEEEKAKEKEEEKLEDRGKEEQEETDNKE